MAERGSGKVSRLKFGNIKQRGGSGTVESMLVSSDGLLKLRKKG